MKTCYVILYEQTAGISTPVFNVVVSVFPFLFLSLLLLKADEQNRHALPRHTHGLVMVDTHSRKKRGSKRRTERERRARPRSLLQPQRAGAEVVPEGGTPTHQRRLPWADRVLRAFHFHGAVLPQYFTLVRVLTMVDFASIVFLLIATDFEQVWFRVASIAIRFVYRVIEFSVCCSLCMPMKRLKSDPRQIVFDWHPVMKVSVPLASVLVVEAAVGWGLRSDFVPQYDFTFARAEETLSQGALYERYLVGSTTWAWLIRDCIDVAAFAMFAALPLFATRFSDSPVKQLILPWWMGGWVSFPRPHLTKVSIFLLTTRVLRVVADALVVGDTHESGGPFLCFLGSAYLLELALFALVLFWALRKDSEFIYSDPESSSLTRRLLQLSDVRDWDYVIDWQEVNLHEQIGEGQFQVFSGDWHGTPCAVKRVPYRAVMRGRADDEVEFINYMKLELTVLTTTNHPNIVRFFGFCAEVPTMASYADSASVSSTPPAARRNDGKGGSENQGRYGSAGHSDGQGRYGSAGHSDGQGRYGSAGHSDHQGRYNSAGHGSEGASEGGHVGAEGGEGDVEAGKGGGGGEGGDTPGGSSEGSRSGTSGGRRPCNALARWSANLAPWVEKELWLVMELLPRRSLFDVIGDHSIALPTPRVYQIAMDICRAMAYLVSKRVLHCDLKSPNVFVGTDMRVKVGDFGEAHVMMPWDGNNDDQPLRHYRARHHYGSVEWMAPESLSRFEYSERSDVFGFGVILWEMVSRGRPHSDIEEFEVRSEVVGGRRLQPPDNCDPRLRDHMIACWKEQPGERPTFQQLLTALQEDAVNL